MDDDYLNAVYPEESDVVAAIEGEANNVQGEEIKVEANHTENKGGIEFLCLHFCSMYSPFSPVVVPDLGIE